MSAPVSLEGVRFGRLVAIRDVGSLGACKGRLWECRCDCGSTVMKTASALRSRPYTSCGCLRKDIASEMSAAKIAGHRFGRLIAKQRAGTAASGLAIWRCVCDCGSECEVTSTHLRCGTVKSCGCLRRETTGKMARARALNPEERRRRVLANRKRQRDRRKNDPVLAMQARLSRLHRHALAQVNAIKTSPTFSQLGYTVEEFVTHIERQFTKGMTWGNMNEWQIDHIIPISTAQSVEDVVALNQLSNLRPMWAKENNAKKAKRLSLL